MINAYRKLATLLSALLIASLLPELSWAETKDSQPEASPTQSTSLDDEDEDEESEYDSDLEDLLESEMNKQVYALIANILTLNSRNTKFYAYHMEESDGSEKLSLDIQFLGASFTFLVNGATLPSDCPNPVRSVRSPVFGAPVKEKIMNILPNPDPDEWDDEDLFDSRGNLLTLIGGKVRCVADEKLPVKPNEKMAQQTQQGTEP